MKPDQEQIARELAYVVLAGAGDYSGGHIPGKAEVVVEMRGMVQTIRRHLLIDHSRVALQIADEIEKQTQAVDFDGLIRAAVEREKRVILGKIDEIVRRALTEAVEAKIAKAVEVVAREIANRAADDVFKAGR